MMSLTDRVAKVCLEFFDSQLPSKGKPQTGKEWTVFAAVVQQRDHELEVVAAGTGSKCLGQSELSSDGDLLHDSHAEVLAKRAFRRYLLLQLSDGGSDLFEPDRSLRGYKLKEGISFHFFSTHPPCGDATIASIENDDELITRKKRPRLDQQRTGAKCVDGEEGDELGQGQAYHTALGAIRTKPGRGDPTRSLSCSDKLVKWQSLGWEGSILASVMTHSLLMTSIIICQDNAHIESVERALVSRFKDKLEGVVVKYPQIHLCSLSFAFKQEEGRTACPCSISVVKGEEAEVVIDGRKQGCTKKQIGSSKARVKTCRLQFAKLFLQFIMSAASDCLTEPVLKLRTTSLRETRYLDLKQLSLKVVERKRRFRQRLPTWPGRDQKKWDQFKMLSWKRAKTVLFKASEDIQQDDYVQALRGQGHEVTLIPVIQFKFQLQELTQVVSKVKDYDGVIFTSPRAVQAFAKATQGSSWSQEWSRKQVWCVGQQTEVLAKPLFKVEPKGSESGNGDTLRDMIRVSCDKGTRFLFPSGNLAQDAMQDQLGQVDILVDRVICYETTTNPNLGDFLNKGNMSLEESILVFFSPSGVKSVVDQCGLEVLAAAKTIALGPSTKAALEAISVKPDFVCPQPNAESVLEGVVSIKES